MISPDEYVNWLQLVSDNGGEWSWIRAAHGGRSNAGRRSPAEITKDVLASLSVQKCIKAVAIESNRSEKEVHAEAKAIMDNMAHSFNLPSTKAVGYLVLKCLRRLLDKVMVNMEALRKIRRLSHNNPVVFMPTHRTYVDFLLISLLCYDQDLRLPAICAGADFLTSKFVGEALRRCGAFFIRRSFGSDRLYWTLFTEYVQSHIVHNEAPIEFFVEGQRSRTSKSLYPKFGLVQVIAEPFLRSQVYDTLVVPVTINYDRLLESFLYGRELLGAPKPKETVSGLLKVLQILNQKFGSVFITFAEPISLRSYFAHIDRASISFRPTAHYIYERNVKKTVATLAHEVVYVQNKHTILTLWPLAASAIQAELRVKGHVNHGDLIEKVVEMYDLCRKLELNVWMNRSVQEDLDYYLQLYADLFEVDGERLKLKAADVNRSTDLPEDVLQDAIPNVVLHNAVNPLAYLLSDFGFVLIVCREQAEYTRVEREFTFLRTVFEKEFVQKPNSAAEDLRLVVDVLVNADLLERNGDEFLIRDLQAASVLTKPIESFLDAYSSILSIIAKDHEPQDELLSTCRKQLAATIQRRESSSLAHLSSDLIKNVITCAKARPDVPIQAAAREIRKHLDRLTGARNVRSRL